MSEDFNKEAVVKRIRALMEKTIDRGCTEEEATAAAEKAQELLEKYQLSVSELKLKEDNPCARGERNTMRKKYDHMVPVAIALHKFCDVKFRYDPQPPFDHLKLTFFGLESDVLVATYIYDIVDKAIIRAGEEFRRDPIYINADGSNARSKLKTDFEYGMASRIAQRLLAMNADKIARKAMMSSGRALVVVKSDIVDKAARDQGFMGFGVKPGRSKNRNVDAFRAGVKAGDGVSINPGINRDNAQQIR